MPDSDFRPPDDVLDFLESLDLQDAIVALDAKWDDLLKNEDGEYIQFPVTISTADGFSHDIILEYVDEEYLDWLEDYFDDYDVTYSPDYDIRKG